MAFNAPPIFLREFNIIGIIVLTNPQPNITNVVQAIFANGKMFSCGGKTDPILNTFIIITEVPKPRLTPTIIVKISITNASEKKNVNNCLKLIPIDFMTANSFSRSIACTVIIIIKVAAEINIEIMKLVFNEP